MSEHGFKLTMPQIISSLLGYCGIGVAIACFVPLIPGIVLLGAPLTQIFLACWYFIADLCMLVELISWGHPGRLAPKPTPAKTLIKKREKESKSRFILHFDQQFSDWSLWDNTKLVIGCIFIGTAWWGLYLVIMLHKTAGEFVIEVPTSHTPAALALGSLGTALFTIARFPELYEGWIRDRKKEKPTLSLSDGTFVFLIIENLFNLLSIFVLSMGPQLEGKGKLKTYIFGELPWILGGIIPIIFDAVLVDRIIVWQKNWKKHSYANEPEKKDELDHLAIDIERAKAALAHFQELSENVEVESTAIEHHAQMQRRNEKRSRGGWTNRVRDSVGRPKEKTSPLQKDYHENLTGLLRETANGRAHKALADKHGSLGFYSDASASLSDSAYGSDSSDIEKKEYRPLQSQSRARTSSHASPPSTHSKSSRI